LTCGILFVCYNTSGWKTSNWILWFIWDSPYSASLSRTTYRRMPALWFRHLFSYVQKVRSQAQTCFSVNMGVPQAWTKGAQTTGTTGLSGWARRQYFKDRLSKTHLSLETRIYWTTSQHRANKHHSECDVHEHGCNISFRWSLVGCNEHKLRMLEHLTFWGSCIVIYSYNKTNEMR